MFRLKIDTGNAAFDEMREKEVIRILKEVCADMQLGDTKGNLHDINGNPVGSWSLTYPKHITKGK
jgi:hypothetical protein